MSLSVRGANGPADFASDCIGGTHYPRVKVTFGVDGAAADVSSSAPLPVTIISGGGSSGGLSNTELRASPVPVSGTVSVGTVPVTGTFWQATQPISGTVSVSGSVAVTGAFYQATQPISGTVTANAGTGTFAISAAVLPLPSGAATETTLASVNTKTPSLGQAVMTGSSPVVIASNQSAVPVSGTFWQGTQPVSGTFWQATQPVSGTVTITPPTLTKGSQGATGVSTQDLKDAGRTQFSAATVIGGVTCVTTEAMLSMVPVRAGVASGGATTIAVTSGKTLRLTAIVFSGLSTSAAVLSARCALRMNPSGAAIATSPILAILSVTQQAAALAQAGDTCVLPLPDGIEISGTQQVGLSQVCSATTGVVYASLVGFEY